MLVPSLSLHASHVNALHVTCSRCLNSDSLIVTWYECPLGAFDRKGFELKSEFNLFVKVVRMVVLVQLDFVLSCDYGHDLY
jgi:hypothetical protein